MSDKPLKTHRHTFNPRENGGEQLTLITKFYHNGDKLKEGQLDPKGVFLNQELVLNSYGNSASISLCGSPIDADCAEKLAKSLRAAQHELELEISHSAADEPERKLRVVSDPETIRAAYVEGWREALFRHVPGGTMGADLIEARKIWDEQWGKHWPKKAGEGHEP